MWALCSAESCATCPLASRGPTRRRKDGVRTLQTSVSKAATSTRQREQKTGAFKERYKIRSGIESTNAELKSRHRAGSLRVRGTGPLPLAEPGLLRLCFASVPDEALRVGPQRVVDAVYRGA